MSKATEKEKNKKVSLMQAGNAKSYVEFLIASKIPFQMICSNYTTNIKSDIFQRKFVHSFQSPRCFAAFSKIKSDVKKTPTPIINKAQLAYFLHDFNKNMEIDSIVNIDLKSAYATVLFNDGHISQDTYDYLAKIPKHDRLAAVGMLASKKLVFDFNGHGEIEKVEEQTSPTENFFYHAVKRTFEIMTVLKMICGESYLFTWVDGIYFTTNNEALNQCIEYLDSIGFKYSVDVLKAFKLIYTDAGIRLSFVKDGNEKRFQLPPRSSEFNRIIADAMMLHYSQQIKKSKNETNKSKISPKQS